MQSRKQTRNDVAIVILAAGLGTRMKSKTAKVLHEAGGRALIDWVVSTALSLAPRQRVFVVVGHQADVVRERLAARSVRIIEQKKQLGTAHAVLAGRRVLASAASNLMVLYGDVPLVRGETLKALLQIHAESGAAASVLTTRIPDPTGYGRIVRSESGAIEAIVEQKDANPEQLVITEINSGIYCFQTRPLFKALARVRSENRSGEFYLTDVIASLVARGLTVETARTEEAREVLGVNNRAELAELDATLRARKSRELMLDGVTIERPETVRLDPDISIGADTTLEPFVQVLGHTEIGPDCRIGACSMIRNARLGPDVVVGPFTFIEDSLVDRGARVGPYARVRPGSHICQEAHVGNFVELKKTTLGRRSKAMHLAYLGDSEIGADVNIGAGTITCNYDGVKKHPTTIENGVFVGSNSTLVAPITIGKSAYLAAGSVLTENVPAGSLGIGRSRQIVKPGWVVRRRKKGKPSGRR